MRIILVEDNVPFGEEIARGLSMAFRDVIWLRTESEFRSRFDEIVKDPPDTFVLDVMLRWDDPRREGIRPRTPDIIGAYNAGMRCAAMLARAKSTCNVPVILYSVLDWTDIAEEMASLPGNIHFLQKTVSIDSLIALVGKLSSRGSS